MIPVVTILNSLIGGEVSCSKFFFVAFRNSDCCSSIVAYMSEAPVVML